MDEDIRNEAANLLLKYFPDRDEVEQNKMLKMIEEMFNSLDLLSVYSIDSNIELDEAILNSLLKARKYLMNNQQSNSTDQSVLKAQLSFALKWNRIDVARKFILDIQDMWKVNSTFSFLTLCKFFSIIDMFVVFAHIRLSISKMPCIWP